MNNERQATKKSSRDKSLLNVASIWQLNSDGKKQHIFIISAY